MKSSKKNTSVGNVREQVLNLISNQKRGELSQKVISEKKLGNNDITINSAGGKVLILSRVSSGTSYAALKKLRKSNL